jgi:hypothetical protein
MHRRSLFLVSGFFSLSAACGSKTSGGAPSEEGSSDASTTDAHLRDDAGGGEDARNPRDASSGLDASGDSATLSSSSDASLDSADVSPQDGAISSSSDASQDARDAASDASSDGSTGCAVQATTPSYAGAAVSTGFTGTSDAYFDLFNVVCTTAASCVPSCVAAGGTTASCTTGSLCDEEGELDGGTIMTCLPPTYWLDVSGALSNSMSTAGAADYEQAFDNGYNDTLALSAFGVSIPSDGVIQGIQFQVDRSGDSNSVDNSIRVLKGGAPVGMDHKASGAWPDTLTFATYGGPSDTWGATWTPADITSTGFGIAVTPQQINSMNNLDYVYIDAVRVTVYYTVPCD